MTAWSRKTWKFWAIFASSRKTTPYGKIFKILFRKFSPPHRSTLLCSDVVKFVGQEIGKSCVIYLTKKQFRLPLKQSPLRGSRPKSAVASRPAPNNVLTVLQISSESVHFRRCYSRMREHRFLPRIRVFPWFAEATFRFRRIINTSLRCRWQTRTMQCLTPTVLYTDGHSQCDKLVPDNRYKFITLTVHLSWQHESIDVQLRNF